MSLGRARQPVGRLLGATSTLLLPLTLPGGRAVSLERAGRLVGRLHRATSTPVAPLTLMVSLLVWSRLGKGIVRGSR